MDRSQLCALSRERTDSQFIMGTFSSGIISLEERRKDAGHATVQYSK